MGFWGPDIEKLEADKDVEGLIKGLEYIHLKYGAQAAKALGEVGDARAVEPLIQALNDPQKRVRESAAGALVKIGEPAVKPLIQALKNVSNTTLNAVVDTLTKLGETAVDSVIQALDDENSDVRVNASYILVVIRDERALESLIQALKDNDHRVRLNAAIALGEIGDDRAISGLGQALMDDHPNVRKHAKKALKKIQAKHTDKEEHTFGNIIENPKNFKISYIWVLLFIALPSSLLWTFIFSIFVGFKDFGLLFLMYLTLMALVSVAMASNRKAHTISVTYQDKEEFLSRLNKALDKIKYQPHIQTKDFLTYSFKQAYWAPNIHVQLGKGSAKIVGPSNWVKKLQKRLQ